jgi:hypothetical protein
MPWVCPVNPHVLRKTVTQPSAALEEASSEITNQVEIRIFDDDTHTYEPNTFGPPDININMTTKEGFNRPLVDALRWAAARYQPAKVEDLASQRSRGLVVLAESTSLLILNSLEWLLESGFSFVNSCVCVCENIYAGTGSSSGSLVFPSRFQER